MTPLNKPYKGNGVVVGVVDVGFDFTHPNMYDATGSNYRVKKVWVQGNTSGTTPAGYSYGSEYTTKEDILGVLTDNQYDTHGTHTSGIAAAGGYHSDYGGMAPESDMILVGTNMSTTGIVDGINYIKTQAQAENKPCVINLSIGAQTGPHDGTSASDRAIDQLAGEGAIIVGAAGNEGDRPIHIQRNYSGNAKEGFGTFIVANDYNTAKSITLDIWGRNNSAYTFAIYLYSKKDGVWALGTGSYSASQESVKWGFNKTDYTTQGYYVTAYNQLNPGNNCYNTLVYIEAQSGSNLLNENDVFLIEVYDENKNTINMWTTGGTLSGGGMGFTDGDTNYTVSEIGGTSNRIVTVGAYASKLSWNPLSNPNSTVSYTANQQLYAAAAFSGKGPTADERMKPEVSAPGFGVVSGYNSWNNSFKESNNMTVAKKLFNNREYYWGVQQGTSMAAPVVTGTVALWLEANPDLTPEQVKEIISNHSTAATQTRAGGDNVYGWGKLDAFSGINAAIALGVDQVTADKDQAISISPNPSNGQFSVSTEVPFTKIQVTDLSGRTVYQNELSAPQQNCNVTLEKMVPGIYMVSIFAENDVITSKVVIY